MPTAALTYVNALVALYKAGPALCQGRVVSGRAIPLQLAHDSQIFVRLVRSIGRPSTMGGHLTQWETLIGTEIAVRCNPGQDAHAAVDPILLSVFDRLAAAPQPANTLTWLTSPDITWELSEADTTVAVATVALRVTHITGPATLAALA
jgi:hypothetical protein